MNVNEIKELVALFAKANVDSLKISQDGFELKLGKRGPGRAKPVTVAVQDAAPVDAAVEISEPDPVDPNLETVVSPIVGTYYSAPNPKADSFVKPGDQVKVGQTLCIVEAMKLMNEIQAEISGEIVACLVENAQPVEYGQPLFTVRQNG